MGRVANRGVQGGFSLVELLFGLAIAGLVGGVLVTLIMSQNRGYANVRQQADVRDGLRSMASVLSWDLRFASASEGDLYKIGANEVELRSFLGSGVVCTKEPGGKYGLAFVEGDVSKSADSVLVFSAGGFTPADDQWKVLTLKGTTGGGSGCAWSGGPSVEQRISIEAAAQSDTSGVRIGAPVRSFHSISYAPLQWRGRWWLGRRVAGSGAWEPLAGPLPDSAGLQLVYYDGLGNVTTDPAAVRSIEFALRAESTRRASGTEGVRVDSLRQRVHLRG